MKKPYGLRADRKNVRPQSKGTGSRGRESFRATSREVLPDGVFAVEGVAAIREYLKHKPSAVIGVFAKEKSMKSVREELGDLAPHIASVPENNERALPPTPAWAHVRHESADWTAFIGKIKQNPDQSPSLVLVLDHISDPRNLGAIVRSAAFFGVKQVIVPERRQVLLTQAGVNTAQGGFALCDLIVVVNVSRAIEELKNHDYWVLGAAMGGEPIGTVRGRYRKQVLVLGSEDKGISQSVLGRCDVVVAIPGAANSLESLNVSVAGGILIHELAGHN